MTAQIDFSLQDNAYDNDVRQCELAWPKAVELLFADLRFVSRKGQGLAWVPARFAHVGEEARKDVNVESVSCLVIDLDKQLSEKDLHALHDKVVSLKCAYVMHLTQSCHEQYQLDGHYKARVVLPLSKPIAREGWLPFWERARAFFGDWEWDKNCKNPSRLYYLPSVPSRAAFDWMIENDWLQYDVTSPPLDVNVIGLSKKAVPSRPEKQGIITSTPLAVIESTLRDHVRLLKAQPHKQTLGMALGALLDGREYSTEGERNPTMNSLNWYIAHEFPYHDPDHLAQLYRRSQDLMSATHSKPADSLEKIALNIKSAQKKCLEGRAMLADKQQSRESRLIYRATGVADADYRYSDEDRADMAARLGISVEAIDDHWVMSDPAAKEFFVLTKKGVRGYFQNDNIWKMIYKELIPTGITMDIPRGNKGRMQPITYGDFVTNHGTVLRGMAYDNRIAECRLRADGTLLLPVERSPLQPVYHENVDGYLKVLFGAQYQKAKEWCAWMRDTSEPIAACILVGKAEIGKTLLATGLSKMWAFGQPVGFENAMEKFTNFDLSATPFIFADEKLPSNHNVTKSLREFVATSEFLIEKKFASTYRLLGYQRVLVASNNLDKVLQFHKDDELEKNDLDALANRLWVVDGQDEAKTYLQSLPYTERTQMAQYAIAEHALWLEANEKPPRPPSTRLAITGSGDVGQHMVLHDPQVRVIFTLIMRSMRHYDVKANRDIGIYWGKGYLRVTPAGIIEHMDWPQVTRAMRWTNPVAHLRKIATRSTMLRHGKRPHVFVINRDVFLAYIDEHQGENVEYFRDMINGEGN